MLSYRHSFHAGNRADVFKHVVLAEIVSALCKKDKPFAFFDTHAGKILYRIDGDDAAKTGEAERGIVELLRRIGDFDDIPETIAKYAEFERALAEKFGEYGGSAAVARHFARACDEIVMSERHPAEFPLLKTNISRLLRANPDAAAMHAHFRDGYEMLGSLLPPKKPLPPRGVAFIDPSYEDDSDFDDVAAAVEAASKKWRGCIAVWHPVVPRRDGEVARLKSNVASCFENVASFEMRFDEGANLCGSGMIVGNPPWKVEEAICADKAFLERIWGDDFQPRSRRSATSLG